MSNRAVLRRRPIVALALLVLALPSGRSTAAPCWLPPVVAPVVDPFREPPCRWCPGNRGIELGTPPGTAVRAVATGRVTFAGTIGGTTFVVVRHADGWRVTYGNLMPTALRAGDLVIRGAVVGTTAGHLHFGLRDGDRYLDPAPYLGELRYRPRLVPSDGTPGGPAGDPSLRCPVGGARRFPDRAS